MALHEPREAFGGDVQFAVRVVNDVFGENSVARPFARIGGRGRVARGRWGRGSWGRVAVGRLGPLCVARVKVLLIEISVQESRQYFDAGRGTRVDLEGPKLFAQDKVDPK